MRRLHLGYHRRHALGNRARCGRRPRQPLSPARILNLSLGAPGTCGVTWQNAINAVNARGAVVIVAAGNENQDLSVTSSSPAVCNGVLAVAASTRSGQRASYSNYGSAVAISAPGGATSKTSNDAILSTLDGGLTVPLNDSRIDSLFGTSMATAHVAGVASLLLSHNPALTREQVVTALTGAASVTAFPSNSNCAPGSCGAGILNARLALDSLTGVVAPPAVPSSGGGGAPTAGCSRACSVTAPCGG
jgi:serine protease